jgi:hypothetical protein
MQKKASFAYAIENNRLWDRQMVDYWHVTAGWCGASVNAVRDPEVNVQIISCLAKWLDFG